MITRTRFKLEEARFFHEHLKKHWRHVPNYEFYLSAFVSAARSVTWVMRSEYSRASGWEDWFDARQPPKHLRELLRKMNDLRVRSTKTEPIRTRTTVKFTVPPEQVTPEIEALLRPGAGAAVHIVPTDSSNTEANLVSNGRLLVKGRIEHVEHEVPEFKGRDAQDVCLQYLAELESLVAECESRFGA